MLRTLTHTRLALLLGLVVLVSVGMVGGVRESQAADPHICGIYQGLPMHRCNINGQLQCLPQCPGDEQNPGQPNPYPVTPPVGPDVQESPIYPSTDAPTTNTTGGGGGTSFKDIVNNTIVGAVDGTIIPLLYILAFLFFLYGIARNFFSYSEEKRQEGKKFALWGIIGLVILFSVWGVVKLFLAVLTNGL